MTPTCSILVLNYNGQILLQRFLETVVDAAVGSHICKTGVVLVDNQSTDGSIKWVSARYPQVKVYLAPTNRYLYSLNEAVRDINTDIVMLLNNDIEMTSGCMDPLFDGLLSNPHAFSITPQLFETDRKTPNAGRFVGRFERGMLTTKLANNVTQISPTIFGCGGALVMRRSSFIDLNGFDDLYYPIYWEDTDLAYRAWKRGLPSLYQPKSVMYHVHSASMNEDKNYKNTLLFRNCLLFTWRNVTDRRLLTANIFWTLRYYVHALRSKNEASIQMYKSAFALLNRAVRKRVKDESKRVLSDKQIVDKAASLFFS